MSKKNELKRRILIESTFMGKIYIFVENMYKIYTSKAFIKKLRIFLLLLITCNVQKSFNTSHRKLWCNIIYCTVLQDRF